jgi:hypothetical protein
MATDVDIERGRLAQDVLDNEVYADAYTKIEQGIIQKWRDARDKDEREHLHRLLLCLQAVRDNLRSVMQTGELAKHSLEQRQTWAERATRSVRRSLLG